MYILHTHTRYIQTNLIYKTSEVHVNFAPKHYKSLTDQQQFHIK